MAGSDKEISAIDILDDISNVIDNTGTRKIIKYFLENPQDAVKIEEFAKEFKVKPTVVRKALGPLLERKIIRASTGKKTFISWNHDSKEGKVLFNLFQPVKSTDEFFDYLARYCVVFLDDKLSEDIGFKEHLKNRKSYDEKRLKLDKAEITINEEKLRIQKERQKLKKDEYEIQRYKDELKREIRDDKKQKGSPGKKTPPRKVLGLLKFKSMFKADQLDADTIELEKPTTKIIKPEVMTMPQVGEAVALQLPAVQECGVCQGEIDAKEMFIKCSCELITHIDCVFDEQICPQCGRHLDLDLMLPENYTRKKAPKKPTIYKEKKREIEKLEPPNKSYFAHVPQVNKESRIKNFVKKYYDKHEMGRSTKTKNVSDIDVFLSIKAAKKMLDHCYYQGREKEVMGLILGETYEHEDGLFSIAKDVATSDLDATQINVKFKSFEKLFKQLGDLQYDYQIIGWYHSHPGHTCFMSKTDVVTQERMFKQPHQRAIIIDPIEFDMKAFALDQKSKKKVKESGFAIIDFKD